MARLLLADDDPQVCDLMRRVLESEGHEVVTAPDGETAIELYRKGAFDVVILDIYMPEKAGLEAILELRDEHPEIRIVAISGGVGAFGYEPLDTARHFGVTDTLAKPFHPLELVGAVDRALAR